MFPEDTEHSYWTFRLPASVSAIPLILWW